MVKKNARVALGKAPNKGTKKNDNSKIKASHKQKVIRSGADPDFIDEITPSYITFSSLENMYVTDTGYIACIEVVNYPEEPGQFSWISQFSRYENGLLMLSVEPREKADILSQANRAYNEYAARESNGKISEMKDAAAKQEEMQIIIDKYRDSKVEARNLVIRLYLSSISKAELETQIADALQYLKGLGYTGAVNFNYQKEEYQALFLPLRMQKNVARPQLLDTQTLAFGDPYDRVDLLDPRGLPLGSTQTGGQVLLDIFHADDNRTSYNGAVFGLMGSGKSTFFKTLVRQRFACNDVIRIAAVSAEYKQLVEEMGGITRDVFGGRSKVNPAQVMANVTDDETGEILEGRCFTTHINKLVAMFRILNREMNDDDGQLASIVLTYFYYHFYTMDQPGFQPNLGVYNKQSQIVHITDLQPEQYPLMSQLGTYLDQYKEWFLKIMPEMTDESYGRLKRCVMTMSFTERELFEGYTNFSDNDNQKLVFYDLSGSKNYEGNPGVAACQIFSMMLSIQNDATINGTKEKKLYEQGLKKKEDIVHFISFLDEFQEYVNANFPFAISFYVSFLKEMRKLFAGAFLVTQTPQPFLEGNDHVSKQLKDIFNLCTYKFIFKSESPFSDFHQLLGNTVTEHMIGQTPSFKKGDCLVGIGGNPMFRMHVYYDPANDLLWGGGV